MQNNKNIVLATFLSALILLGWTWFFEKPRIEKQEAQKQFLAKQARKKDTTRKYPQLLLNFFCARFSVYLYFSLWLGNEIAAAINIMK